MDGYELPFSFSYDFPSDSLPQNDISQSNDTGLDNVDNTGPGGYLRENIREEVDAILWLDQLKKDDIEYKQNLKEAAQAGGERCLVCTLPCGTCEHTKIWIEEKETERQDIIFREKTDLDQQINDILNVMGDDDDGLRIETAPVLDDIDIHNMQWNVLEQRLTDKIGNQDVCLFSPDERGWQSVVKLTPTTLLVFGGFRFKKTQVPEPFKAVPLAHEVEYLNDVRMYDCNDQAWHGIKARGTLPTGPGPGPAAATATAASGVYNNSDYLDHSGTGALLHSQSAEGSLETSYNNAVSSEPVFPEGRYGHIAAVLDAHRMLVFGGRAEKGRVLNDTWVFHLQHDAWELVQNTEALNLPLPPPRYFSSCESIFPNAVEMANNTAHSFSVSGTITRDELSIGTGFRSPGYGGSADDIHTPFTNTNTKQYKNGAAAVPGPYADVYMFGGTDGTDNFGDLWVFRGHPNVMRWERLVAVGLPPCPRYGHKMILLTGDGDFGNTPMDGARIAGAGQQLMVLGGCSVSPQGEMVGSNLGVAETQALMALSSELRRNYRAEESFSQLAGTALESMVMLQSDVVGLDGVYKQAADATGALHELELRTRIAEREMVDRYKASAGNMQFNIKQARHPTPHVDVTILNVTEMMWRSQIYPPIRGDLPSCRIHFGAACIGNHVFVLGGIDPTSLKYKHVDDGNTLVYVLDLRTMKWEQPTAVNSEEHLREALKIADADVIRAYRRCDEEKARGMALGALNGKTIELCEAQAVLEVCKWRRSVLQKEQHDQTKAPNARFGASMVAQGQRLVYVGGWENGGDGSNHFSSSTNTNDGSAAAGSAETTSPAAVRNNAVVSTGRAVPQGMTMVCNVEHAHERQRRLHDEFQAKLERERIAEEAQANMANVQSIFELRAKLRKEKEDQERERRHMAFEDILSAQPPLYKPSAVEFVKANEHTVWVKWDRLYKNSNREMVDPDSVTYFLYVRSSFENLQVGDRVYVTAPLVAGDRSRVGSRAGTGAGVSDKWKFHGGNTGGFDITCDYDGDLVYFDDDCKRYPAEIVKLGENDTFEVLFDDGALEKEVPRRRIKLAAPIRYSKIPLDMLSGKANRGGSSAASSRGLQRGKSSPTAAGDAVTTAAATSSLEPPNSARSTTSSGANVSTAAMLHADAPLAVVPLELSGLVKNRIKQRILRFSRAANRLDAFRGITEEMKAKKEKDNRRRERRRQMKKKKLAAHRKRKHRKSKGNDLESIRRQRSKDGSRKGGRHQSSRKGKRGAGGASTVASSAMDSAFGGSDLDFTLPAVIGTGVSSAGGPAGGGGLDTQLGVLRRQGSSRAGSAYGSTASSSDSYDSGSRGTLSRSGSFMSASSYGSGDISYDDDDDATVSTAGGGGSKEVEGDTGKQHALRPALSRRNNSRFGGRGVHRMRSNVSFSADVDDDSVITADSDDRKHNDSAHQLQKKHQQQQQQQSHGQHNYNEDNLFGDAVFTGSADPDDPNVLGDDGGDFDESMQTVHVDPRWKLVYVGNDTSYSCTGLVALDAIQKEPLLSVPVAFCLQVHGVDRPMFERSQLSNTVFFYTQPMMSLLIDPAADDVAGTLPAAGSPATASDTVSIAGTVTSSVAAAAKASANIAVHKKGMSKTKKEIISAVLTGKKMVQIERLDDTCISYGRGEDFL